MNDTNCKVVPYLGVALVGPILCAPLHTSVGSATVPWGIPQYVSPNLPAKMQPLVHRR